MDNVNLSIDEGEFVVVREVSGSGKSTLLHMLGLLDTPSSGNVILDGIDVGKLREGKLAALRNEKIGFVLQDFGLISYRSVLDNCMVSYYFSSKKLPTFEKEYTLHWNVLEWKNKANEESTSFPADKSRELQLQGL